MVVFDQFSVVKVSRPASLCGYIRLSCCTSCLVLALMFCCYLRFELECNLRRFEFNGLRCWEPLKSILITRAIVADFQGQSGRLHLSIENMNGFLRFLWGLKRHHAVHVKKRKGYIQNKRDVYQLA